MSWKWRKWRALPSADRRLLLEASSRMALAWIVLRIIPFAWLARSLSQTKESAVPPDEIRKIRWAVESIARHSPFPLMCVPQGFGAAWMLKVRGAAPRMHFGVAHGDNGFESHVWVELNGVPVVGHRVAGRFTLMKTFPA